jgi:hypothetical protein
MYDLQKIDVSRKAILSLRHSSHFGLDFMTELAGNAH